MGRYGRMIEIGQDVMDICQRIQEIDPSLGVQYSEDGCYFRIYQKLQGGKESTVTTCQELTPQLVGELHRIAHPEYDFAKELDRLDDKADRDKSHAFREQIGEHSERLAHAIRKDIQDQSYVYIPKSIRAA